MVTFVRHRERPRGDWATMKMNGLKPSVERRAHYRLPLTLAARIVSGTQSHRTKILNLSRGGLLLAPSDAFQPVLGDALWIEGVLIGIVQVEVVALSPLGVHVKIRDASADYGKSFSRLSMLATTWQRN